MALNYKLTIWEDITHDAEAIVIEDTSYDPALLSNIFYDIMDDRVKRRQVLLKNKYRGLFKIIDDIRAHRTVLEKSEPLTHLITTLFHPEKIHLITGLDRVYLNAYYRKVLRAKLERDYMGKELLSGVIITEYANYESDGPVAAALRGFRVICQVLGIPSTTHETSFPLEKLSLMPLWKDIFSRFFKLYGENRMKDLEETPGDVLVMLNVIFNTWSGTTLTQHNTRIKVSPSTYIVRLLPLLL